jgi:hypothetical protein
VPTSTGTPNSCRWCNIIQNGRTVASRRLLRTGQVVGYSTAHGRPCVPRVRQWWMHGSAASNVQSSAGYIRGLGVHSWTTLLGTEQACSIPTRKPSILVDTVSCQAGADCRRRSLAVGLTTISVGMVGVASHEARKYAGALQSSRSPPPNKYASLLLCSRRVSTLRSRSARSCARCTPFIQPLSLGGRSRLRDCYSRPVQQVATMQGRVWLGRLPSELELELAVPEGVRNGRSRD